MSALPKGARGASRPDADAVPPVSAAFASSVPPAALHAALWRADRLGRAEAAVVPSGHAALDAQLPGGGWPRQGLTEVLQPQAGGAEFRLLEPALRRLAAGGAPVLLVGPPHRPHWPGWGGPAGLPRLLWVRADSTAERLWAVEQALRCGDFAAVLVWLPQASFGALRRLQAQARQGGAPLFVFRPLAAQGEASPAPLRLCVGPDASGAPGWLQLRLLKRRGPLLEAAIRLAALPSALTGLASRRRGRAGAAPVPRPEESRPAPLPDTAADATASRPVHALVRADSVESGRPLAV